ncbi:carnitine dehydratase [Streptomyces sp. CB00455]|uniref:CoA transferase n=1 Tax=Streptomyces sp. CB00455 TaxID=1703927 RepID=UPI0009393A87|nr:CoA transferase [Streptomyces sp. CB00455]OKK16754.1 carnitine dehydratase [Streptomyces sp. CB00455]
MTITGESDEGTARAWAALGGAPQLAACVGYRGAPGLGEGPLPVRELARATVGVCALAAAELGAVRAGGGAADVAPLVVDEGAVATAFVSERHLRIAGRRPSGFAPLSGFWRAADGWVRTHANYPHHRAALVRALELPSATPRDLRAAVAARPAAGVQELAYAQGALAVAVAPAYGARQPLVEAAGGPGGTGRPLGPAPAALPAAGVRVLDLTRVIAGPVATRTLGLLGADVLRIDAPGLPEADDTYADTGFGKRSALLDLADAADREVFEGLLASADVVVSGYRPGALERFGLGAADLLERRPGLVVAQLCAWGRHGPWAGRRGFDSLVQAGYGIAARYASADGTPGALPAQALDHGTGYLMAAAVLRALADGGGRALRFSLAGTASWLVHDLAAVQPGAPGYAPGPWLREGDSGYGPLRHAVSPLGDWPAGPSRWGTGRPVWLPR